MPSPAAALLEQIDVLERGAKEDKRLAAHHRRALVEKMEQLRILRARCRDLRIRLIVQERSHGSISTDGSTD